MADHLCPLIEAQGLTLPPEIFVEYDLIKYKESRTRAWGQCLHKSATLDGKPQIYISPDLTDPVRTAEVILHELLHAALPPETVHGEPFVTYAKRVGLRVLSRDGQTDPGPTLAKHFKFLIAIIGPYPPPPELPAQVVMPESHDYPRMLFHRTKPPAVVASRACEAALGKEWSRSPWTDDGSPPRTIDWAWSWLKGQGFPKSYHHRDTGEERIVRNPDEERTLQNSGLWYLYPHRPRK